MTVSDNQTYAAPSHKISDENDLHMSSMQTIKQIYDPECLRNESGLELDAKLTLEKLAKSAEL